MAMCSGSLLGRGMRASAGYVRNLPHKGSSQGLDAHRNLYTSRQSQAQINSVTHIPGSINLTPNAYNKYNYRQRSLRSSLCSCQYILARNKSAMAHANSQSDSDSYTQSYTSTRTHTKSNTNTYMNTGLHTSSRYNGSTKHSKLDTQDSSKQSYDNDNTTTQDKNTRAQRTRMHTKHRNIKLRDRETAEEEAIERLNESQMRDKALAKKRRSIKPLTNTDILSGLQLEYGNKPPEKIMPESQRLKHERQELAGVENRSSAIEGVVVEGESGKRTGWENIDEELAHLPDYRSVVMAPAHLPAMLKRDRASRGSKHLPNKVITAEAGDEGDEDESLSGAQRVVYEQDIAQWAVPNYSPFDPANQPANARTLSVALLGGANTGKSTLINAFLDTKLCMVSPIQQTTIQRQLGVLTKDEVQIRFYDTPGLINNRQKNSWRLPQSVVSDPQYTATEVDLVGVLIDVSLKNPLKGLEMLHQNIDCKRVKNAVLIINKVDIIKDKREYLLPMVKQAMMISQIRFDKVFYISALNNDGVATLKNYLMAEAKPGDWEYAPSEITDMPPLTRIEEVVREKLMTLGQELPYTTQSHISRIRRIEGGEIMIDVDIVVRRKSQIKIVLGKRGDRLREIRETAQAELSSMFNQYVNITMQVKV